MSLGLDLGFFWSFGLRLREISTEAESDSASNAETTLARSAVVREVVGVEVIGGSELKTDVTEKPEIPACADGKRER